MPDWLTATRQIEALEEIALDPLLVLELERQPPRPDLLSLHVPGYKSC